MGRIGGISRPAAIAMAVACLSASTAAAATGSLVLTLSTVAVSIALIAATILGLSRTSPGRDEAPVVNRLELAHQRISAAVTEEQLGTRAAEELVDMLDTPRVAFIPVEHGRLVIDRGAGGLVIKPSSRSFLAEVSTQRPTTKTTGTGPDGVALVGCPVRIGAKTVAVLVGARDGDHAFTLTEQHVLSRLATMTAKALDELRSSEPEGGSGYEKLPGADELHRDLEALRRERRETTTVLAYVDIDGFLRLAGAEGAETAEWMLESLQRILSLETRDHDRIYRTGHGRIRAPPGKPPQRSGDSRARPDPCRRGMRAESPTPTPNPR